jgi:hypothetical protein
MAKSHEGYLLIADITGYTRYLTESELEHAQETLTALLEMLVEHTSPPLIISRLAGDAVISYGLRDNFFQGQTLLEKIDITYITFRKTIERLVMNNTCRCNACSNIANLDLKFFVHYGTFGIQRISNHDELVGNDINLLHRLLKNHVTNTTGIEAYTLFTDAAARQLQNLSLEKHLLPHQETYEFLGEVTVWVQDMHPVWEARRDEVSILSPEGPSGVKMEVDIHIPREQVWDYLVQPKFRNFLIGADRIEIAHRKDGRIRQGTVFQCYHGDKVLPQTILEWQPFDYMLVKEMAVVYPGAYSNNLYKLETIPDGTRFTKFIGKLGGPFPGRLLLSLLMPIFTGFMRRSFQKFKEAVEQDYAVHPPENPFLKALSTEKIKQAAAESLREE